MAKMIGVEIGNDTIKLVTTNNGEVQQMAAARLPENLVLDGTISSPEAMGEFIKNMRKENGIPGGKAALVLPCHSVITTSVDMPPMSDAELALNLPFEFRDYVGQEGSKYLYDYAVMDTVMGKNGQPAKLELFAAAARKEYTEKLYTILKKAGLTLKTAIPQEMAWLNLVREATNEPRAMCILDVGATVTHIYIFADGKFLMGRELEIGGQLLDASIAGESKVDVHVARTYKETNLNDVLTLESSQDFYNQLAVEVMRAVNFYSSYDNRAEDLNDIYFCGGMANIEELRTAIKKATGMTMHHISRLVPGGIENADTLSCALAVGAAIQ